MFTNFAFYVLLAASSVVAGDLFERTLNAAPKDTFVVRYAGTTQWERVEWVTGCSNIVPTTRVFFSPNYGGEDCLSNIVSEINSATNYIYIQTYVMTSQGIVDSLINAHNRGVNVDVVIDKLCTNYMKFITALVTNNISVVMDHKHAIAHNKIMVMDDYIVITGSYNFTRAAERNNAENLVIFHSVDIAKRYKDNFKIHKGHSIKL